MDFFSAVLSAAANKESIMKYPPITLAYIGDAVYEVYVRTLLVTNNDLPVNKLHIKSTGYVKAKAQAETIHRILPLLTEQEKDIVRRGRNAKSGTIPKNADITEYKYATGFEALIGYLYLAQEMDRLLEILKMCIGDGNGEK